MDMFMLHTKNSSFIQFFPLSRSSMVAVPQISLLPRNCIPSAHPSLLNSTVDVDHFSLQAISVLHYLYVCIKGKGRGEGFHPQIQFGWGEKNISNTWVCCCCILITNTGDKGFTSPAFHHSVERVTSGGYNSQPQIQQA